MTAVLLVLTTVALAARSVGWVALGVTMVAGATGVVTPVARAGEPTTPTTVRQWLAVVATGALAVAVVAWRSPLVIPVPAWPAAAASVAAAVAEEAFFRRLFYGWLERHGAAVAVAGAAAAFALVHVPLYGAASIPVNLAAGVLFGWQRWATGTWTAPAATHAFANVAPL